MFFGGGVGYHAPNAFERKNWPYRKRVGHSVLRDLFCFLVIAVGQMVKTPPPPPR